MKKKYYLLVFILLVIKTIAEVQYRFFTQRFSLMFARNFVFVMLKVALYAEICLLGDAVMSSGHISTFLAYYFLNQV